MGSTMHSFFNTRPDTANPPPPTDEKERAISFVRDVLDAGIRQGASDVHFEPHSTLVQVLFRVDGTLMEHVRLPRAEYSTIINAIKVLADLDISEHAIPQDGHIELSTQPVASTDSSNADEKNARQLFFDIRVSTFPSVNGEVVVMRVLNRSDALRTLGDLGMSHESLDAVQRMLAVTYGMALITGPTGSGKTTTLYAMLNALHDEVSNIITLEDPIEFHLDWLRQCEINEHRGFTFERAIASILRQDPDVLMLGEIRSAETAERAMHIALTGHFVGSTIHANTTAGTIARLLDFGIPRGMLAYALQGIIAQRLVRHVCQDCKMEYTPDPAHLQHFGLSPGESAFFRGTGCEQCHGTGHRGRVGVFSVMSMTPLLRSMIFEQKPIQAIEETALECGMETLEMDAASKIRNGSICVEDALRTL